MSMTAEIDGKRDSAAIEKRVEDGFRALDQKLSCRFRSFENQLEAFIAHELRGQTITLFWMQVTVIMTMAALVFSVARYR